MLNYRAFDMESHLGFNSLTTTDTTAQMIIPVYQNEFLQAGV
jgi:hypothetical protein